MSRPHAHPCTLVHNGRMARTWKKKTQVQKSTLVHNGRITSLGFQIQACLPTRPSASPPTIRPALLAPPGPRLPPQQGPLARRARVFLFCFDVGTQRQATTAHASFLAKHGRVHTPLAGHSPVLNCGQVPRFFGSDVALQPRARRRRRFARPLRANPSDL